MNSFYYKEGIIFVNDEDRTISNDVQKIVVDTLVRNSAVGVVSGFYEEGYPIYFVSEFALANIGYDEEILKNEIDGKYINCICPSDRSYYDRIMDMGRDAPKEIEYRLKSKWGEYVWVRDVKVDYVTENGRKAWISSIRIIQNEHMAKREFISTISHNIRSPLNAIMGMAQLAKKNIASKEKTELYINEIIASAEQFMYQISQVLHMNELETTVACLEEKEYNIYNLVDGIVDECNEFIKERNQNIKVEYTDIVNKTVICDGKNITKVLKALISNASEYSSDGSSIIINIKQELLTDSKEYVYEFNVIDEGEGIPYYEIDRLFEPFERIRDVRVTSNQTHMGLGLTVIKSIIELMKGTISVKSKTGNGSCFTVRLKLKPVTVDTYLSDKKTFEVLIVEDNHKNAEIMQEFLALEDINSDIAYNGAEAVDMYTETKGEKYDVILMDIHMPVMDGYEATRRIRDIDKASGVYTPIIAVTADSLPEDINQAMQCGMNGHISKPVDFGELVDIIKAQ